MGSLSEKCFTKDACLAAVVALLAAACSADTVAGGSSRHDRGTPVLATGGGGAVMNGANGAAGVASSQLGPNSPTRNAPSAGRGAPGSQPSATGGQMPVAGVGGATGAMLAGPAGAMSAAASGTGVPAATSGSGGMPAPMLGPGQTLPPVTDYTAPGPFNPTMTMDGTGPDGMYTVYQPANLDQNGFKFVPLTWGNGVTTTPQTYPVLLSTVASHGFVVIASDSTSVSADQVSAGLDWLIKQNDMPGPYQNKLDVTRAVTMGYSLGGGAALTAGSDPRVVATIGMHPAPGNTAGLHAPLLLFTGDQDTIVAPSLVDASFASSAAPTFYVSLSGATHFEPVNSGGKELAPCIAWLRLFVFHDDGAKQFFFGPDCTMCKAPWTPQTKMWPPPGT